MEEELARALPPAVATHTTQSDLQAKRHLVPVDLRLQFFLVTGLFFLWGTPNNLNNVRIRQFMTSFALSRFQAGLVQSAFYIRYFLLAIPTALLMRRIRL